MLSIVPYQKNSSSEKDLYKLIIELEKSNQKNSLFLKSIKSLELQVIEVNKAYQKPSKLINSTLANIVTLTTKPIKNWEEKDIKVWSLEIRKRKIVVNNSTLPEILAVTKHGVLLSEQFLPRDVQILSVLSLLFKNEIQGRLAQIFTGEGKSTIISILAVVQALRGNKVDIVTSSEVLAQRDAEEKSRFYDLFGFSVQHNCDWRSNAKECYKKDIVYGDTLNFQADILYDEYKQFGTRCNRPFDMVIVDEVDNMLIDERLRMTLLSTPIPGMNDLTPVLGTIWNIVNDVSLGLGIIANNYQVPQRSANIDPLVLVKLHLKEYVEKIKDFVISNVPRYLKEYAISQIVNWCFNAAQALLLYKENEHYVVKDNQIIPVDYRNTGVFQKNMHWGEGLHQFLQMKHDLRVTQINLTTNFLSNVSYFKRYSSNIFGLTGTLGSQSEQDLLSDIYSLDTVHIPSYKVRKLQEIPGMIVKNHRTWIDSVKDNVRCETDLGRAVLVICETISKVNQVKQALEECGYDQTLIRTYTEGSEEEKQITKVILSPKQVILATNLAGRGTDIKISEELEQNGGLHVSVTFLPENLRVQEQAFGRAGRQGSPGTAQLIININDDNTKVIYSKYNTIEEIKEARDTREKRYLRIATKETTKVINKDALFRRFCTLMQHISENLNRNNKYNKEILDALEERWALWLLTLSDQDLLSLAHENLFSKFQEQILNDFEKGEIIQNPKYYIRQGHKLFDSKRYEEALRAYETASKMNEFDWYSKYYQAITNIKLQENKKKLDWKSIEQLKEVQKLCADNIASYESLKMPQLQRSMLSTEEETEETSILNQHLSEIECVDTKTSNCNRYEKHIEANYKVLKLIDNLTKQAELAFEAGNVLKIELVNINEIFNAKDTKDVIDDLRVDGLTKIASSEYKTVPWPAIIFTGTLGILELIAGVTLCATGIGAIWGYGLIIEGASDIVTTIVTGITKDFDWKIYIATKSATMALTAVGCGFMSIGALSIGAKVAIVAGDVAIRIGGKEAIRAGTTWYYNRQKAQEQAKQRVENIIKDCGIEEKIKRINKLVEQFDPNNPIYKQEFEKFGQLCTTKLKETIKSKLSNTLHHVVYIPGFKNIVLGAYKKVNDSLDKLLDKSLEKFTTQSNGIVGAGSNAFALLEQSGVIDDIANDLVKELKVSGLDCYTKEKLVYTVAHIILQDSKKELENKIKEKEDLKKQKTNLTEQKSKTQNSEEVKNLKIQLYDIGEKIDEITQQLQNDTDVFNDRVKIINTMDKKIIADTITFLNNKVFKEESIFEVLNENFNKVQEIFSIIPIKPPVIKPLFVEAFNHIYQASVNRAKNLSDCLDGIELSARSGTGSLVCSFFGKYINKIASENNLDIERTVDLARTQFAEEMKKQGKKSTRKISKQHQTISELIGEKQIIPKDGNCFFGSVAVAIGLTHASHVDLRKIAISHIKSNKDKYEFLITDNSFDEYITIYGSNGAWDRTEDGNDIMIDALARALGIHIIIHDTSHDGITQNVNSQADIPIIHLDYTGTHYNAYKAANLAPLKKVKDNLIKLLSNSPLQGIEISSESESMRDIDVSFSTYNLDAIQHILELRIKENQVKNSTILKGKYIFGESYNNIDDMMKNVKLYRKELLQTLNESHFILAPLSLENRHAVGFIFVITRSNDIKTYYIDPSNTTIPSNLQVLLLKSGFQVELLKVEQQRYANCGPEVIENFLLYLSGERLSQENSVPFHSNLVEQQLISNLTDPKLEYSSPLLFAARRILPISKVHTTEHEIKLQLSNKDSTAKILNNMHRHSL